MAMASSTFRATNVIQINRFTVQYSSSSGHIPQGKLVVRRAISRGLSCVRVPLCSRQLGCVLRPVEASGGERDCSNGSYVDVIDVKRAKRSVVGEDGDDEVSNYLGLKSAAQRVLASGHDDDHINDDHDDLRTFTTGKLIDSGLVFRQNFIIRCYEVGPDKVATMETLISLSQEAGVNHAKAVGLIDEGEFIANRWMRLKNLVWIVYRVHVQFYSYTCWQDAVQIDTCADMAGKNSIRKVWIMRDYSSKQTIAKATSIWMMVNKETKRMSKMPEQFKVNMGKFCNKRCALESGELEDDMKVSMLTDETADFIRSDIAPKWNDIDANQHVNYIKYIVWIFECVPVDVWANYNLLGITLEYRRECRQCDILESLSSMKQLLVSNASNRDNYNFRRAADMESTHLLRKQDDKVDIVCARITWKLKKKQH